MCLCKLTSAHHRAAGARLPKTTTTTTSAMTRNKVRFGGYAVMPPDYLSLENNGRLRPLFSIIPAQMVYAIRIKQHNSMRHLFI